MSLSWLNTYQRDHRYLFSFEEIKEIMPEILNRWVENSRKYGTIYNIYFATIFNEKLHLENIFLNLIQALEGMYFASGIQKMWITQEKKKEVQDWIKNHVPPSMKAYIIAKTDVSLEEKLADIEKYTQVKFELNWNTDLKKRIQDIRNIFSHGSDRSKYINMNLVELTHFLKMTLEMFIIKELEIPNIMYSQILQDKLNELKFEI